MKTSIIALLMAALSLAGCAAQARAQEQGPPPAMQAQMQQIRSTAKTAAFNALSADHRARVQAIIDQVNGGSLDRRSAAQQIDAVLTPSETQAVLAQQAKMREEMHAVFAQSGQGGPGPGGPGAGGHGPEGGQHRQPDAGRTLVMLGSNRGMHQPR